MIRTEHGASTHISLELSELQPAAVHFNDLLTLLLLLGFIGVWARGDGRRVCFLVTESV